MQRPTLHQIGEEEELVAIPGGPLPPLLPSKVVASMHRFILLCLLRPAAAVQLHYESAEGAGMARVCGPDT